MGKLRFSYVLDTAIIVTKKPCLKQGWHYSDREYLSRCAMALAVIALVEPLWPAEWH